MDNYPEPITEQAAAYFAQRRRATLPQRRMRDAWLQEDPRHARAYEQLHNIWHRAGRLADDPELQALKALDLAAVRKVRSWPRRMLTVAAVFALTFLGGYLFTAYPEQIEPVDYATVVGERRSETLPDGTGIVLNTNSALEVRYSARSRAITLQRGEAQFDVSKDAARPFVVSIGEDTVTALGTRFQVRRDRDSTTVILLEGKVEVARGEERYTLRPTERAVISERTGIAIAPIDPKLATGWLNGWLQFRDTPLSEVIAEANRYSDRQLRLGNPRLAGIRLSGRFHAGDNASIGEAAAGILPVRIEHHGSEIVLLPH